MKISAVVVTYNRLNMLKKCIYSLLHQNYVLNSIIIINNDSTDGTKNYLNKLNNKKIIVKNTTKNLGGAGGFSLGTKIAYEDTNSDYFWLMDDDTKVSKYSLTYLCKYARKLKGNFGFLSSNVRWWKNGQAVNIPTVSSDWSKLISYSLIKLRESTFVSLFVPRSKVKKVGLPISQAFIWGDDTEYTHRLSNVCSSYFVPSSIVYHMSSKIDSNENIFNESLSRIRFYKYGYRNFLYLDKRYHSKLRFIKDVFIILITLIKIPFKSRGHRSLRFYCTLCGLIDAFFYNPKIQYPKDNK